MDTRERVSHIKLIVFDIDGVMTDGGLHYTDDGRELKTFNVQDGLGLKLLQRAGLELAIVTGRTSGVVTGRASDLGIAHVFQGVTDKRAVVGELLERLGLRWAECAFMGDDLIDLPVMVQCGLAIAPAKLNKAATAKVGASLVARKLMRELKSKPGMPVWREDENGRGVSLMITRAGRDVVGIVEDDDNQMGHTISTKKQKPAAPVYPEADAEPQAVAEPVATTPKPTRKTRARKA